MNLQRACEILEITKKDGYDFTVLKKQYNIMAKKWHPDKNADENAKEKFQEVTTAYEYIKSLNDDFIDVDEDDILNDEFENNYKDYNFNMYYRSLISSFFTNIFPCEFDENEKQLIIQIITKISTICQTKAFLLLQKIDRKITKSVYDILCKFGEQLNLSKDLLCKIETIIDDKENLETKIDNNAEKQEENENVIVLNPSIDDLLEDNLYKLTLNYKKYVIPLWHHELEFEEPELTVFCIPHLPENVFIDDENNIHIEKTYDIKDLWDKKQIEIEIGSRKMVILQNELCLGSQQIIVKREQGIAKINSDNIFCVEKRTDIIIHITINTS